jgi:glyoxylase-like metal-dependent hydrolase (beta-lactamase superfamily II)
LSTVNLHIFNAGYCTCPEHIALRGGRWQQIRFPAMFALIEHPRFGQMLFDTGYSTRFFTETHGLPHRLYRWITPVTLREDQLAVTQLEDYGIRPTDIDRIFISHFHADHISALADFPRARYCYLPQAFDALRSKRGFQALIHAYLPGLVPHDFEQRTAAVDVAHPIPLPPEYAPFTTGFDLLGDETLVAVELPGHAFGQMGLLARTERGVFFFISDAAWLMRNIQSNQPPHALANLLFSDPKTYNETLHALHTFQHNQTDIHIIPSHCAETLAKYISNKEF